jgi:predicted lipid-binding transport protein (Tim44 family)
MPRLLKALGVVVLVLGLGTAAVTAGELAMDVHFREVADAYARHPEHPLFQAEYVAAAARHYGLVAGLVGGLLGGLSLGGILLALGELLRRVPR